MRVCGEFRCPLRSPYERTPQRNNPSQIPYRTAVVGRIRKTGKIVTSFLTETGLHTPTGHQTTVREWGIISNVARICLPLNDFQRVQRTDPRAGTTVASPLPGNFCFEIGRPERPGPALHGASCVDPAPPGLGVQEDAVPVRVVAQTPPPAHQFRVQQPDLTQWFSQFPSDRRQLFVGDPYRPRSPRAAIAALRTLKP
jgi:hypothetical protein